MLRTSNDHIVAFFERYNHLVYKKRDMLLRSDEPQSSIYYIQSGYVRAYRISEDGEELTLLILMPGDIFPMTYGLNNLPNIYYLEAITSLEIRKAPKNSFLEFLKNEPDVFFDLSTQVMDRYDGLLARVEYIVWSKAYSKVAATLLVCARRFGEQQGEKYVVKVPLTHKDIAALVGITRETTSIEMKKLEKKGLIGKSGRLLVINDMKGLQQESLLNNQEELLQNNFI